MTGRVKDLVWVNRHDHGRDNDVIAASIIGSYVIRPSADGERVRLWTPGTRHDDAAAYPVAEVDTAKAAAKADYTARILSALEPTDRDQLLEDMVGALEEFARKPMPSLRRTEIGYDSNGLRRCISPMELAQVRARTLLARATSLSGKDGRDEPTDEVAS